MSFESVAHLQAARRYLTSVLLNLPINPTETTISTLLVMLDHFVENPEEYLDLTNDHTNSRESA